MDGASLKRSAAPNAASWPRVEVDASTVTKEKFREALEKVTEIFKPADLRFAFDPAADWKPLQSTVLNSLHNGGSKWWEAANKVVAQHKGKLVIFLRYWQPNPDNKPANNWFAYPPNTSHAIPPERNCPPTTWISWPSPIRPTSLGQAGERWRTRSATPI